jgi:hypothetical protein
VRDFLSLRFGTQGAPPSLRVPHNLFFVVIAYYAVFFLFFPLCGGSVCPGGYADLAQDCGSIECHLAHFMVHVFPSCLGTAVWQ